MTRWPDDGADPPLEHGVDPLAAFSALMALVAAVGYLLIVNAQGSGSPVLWFLVGLLVGGGLSAYAARRSTPAGRPCCSLPGSSSARSACSRS